MQLFAASTDDVATQKRFAQELQLTIPILADRTKAGATAMGALSWMGFAKRWIFYVGKDGKLLAIDKKVDVRQTGDQIAGKLEELKIAKRPSTDSEDRPED